MITLYVYWWITLLETSLTANIAYWRVKMVVQTKLKIHKGVLQSNTCISDVLDELILPKTFVCRNLVQTANTAYWRVKMIVQTKLKIHKGLLQSIILVSWRPWWANITQDICVCRNLVQKSAFYYSYFEISKLGMEWDSKFRFRLVKGFLEMILFRYI